MLGSRADESVCQPLAGLDDPLDPILAEEAFASDDDGRHARARMGVEVAQRSPGLRTGTARRGCREQRISVQAYARGSPADRFRLVHVEPFDPRRGEQRLVECVARAGVCRVVGARGQLLALPWRPRPARRPLPEHLRRRIAERISYRSAQRRQSSRLYEPDARERRGAPGSGLSSRRRSFAAAAVELNVTASAVSQRIKSLEQSLGVLLFDRLPQGLKPTEAAHLYLLEIRPALNRLRTASARVAANQSRRPLGRDRRLSVDMLPALATARMGPLFHDFHERFPDVALRLTTSRALSDPVRDGFDCCVRYGPGSWDGDGVEARCLARETIFPVCAPKLIAESRAIETPRDLAQLPLIHDLMPLGWSEWCAALGAPDVKFHGPVFSDSALAQRAAVEGLGVALGRSLLVAPDLAAGRLLRPVPEELPSPFSYWLIRPPSRRDRLVDLFEEWLLEKMHT